MVMVKLCGGSGIGHLWLCSHKPPDTFYGFADTLPLNICANFSQHALTTFQSGIVSPSSSVSLLLSVHLSPFLLHISQLVSSKHAVHMLFNPRISFFSWPVRSALYIYICSLQLHVLFATLCSHRHLWLGSDSRVL